MEMRCAICQKDAPEDMNEMIGDGWIAYFYNGEEEVGGPVCPECVKTWLRFNENDWEWEVGK